MGEVVLDDGKVMGSIRQEDSRYLSDDQIDESEIFGYPGSTIKKEPVFGNRSGSYAGIASIHKQFAMNGAFDRNMASSKNIGILQRRVNPFPKKKSNAANSVTSKYKNGRSSLVAGNFFPSQVTVPKTKPKQVHVQASPMDPMDIMMRDMSKSTINFDLKHQTRFETLDNHKTQTKMLRGNQNLFN